MPFLCGVGAMAKLNVAAGFNRSLVATVLLTWASLGLHPLMDLCPSLPYTELPVGSHVDAAAASSRVGAHVGSALANVVIQQKPSPAPAPRRQAPTDKAAPTPPSAPPAAKPSEEGSPTARVESTRPEPAATQDHPSPTKPPAGPSPSEAAAEQLARSLRTAEDKLREGHYEDADALANAVAQRADGNPLLRAKALSVSERAKAAKAAINWIESVR